MHVSRNITEDYPLSCVQQCPGDHLNVGIEHACRKSLNWTGETGQQSTTPTNKVWKWLGNNWQEDLVVVDLGGGVSWDDEVNEVAKGNSISKVIKGLGIFTSQGVAITHDFCLLQKTVRPFFYCSMTRGRFKVWYK